MEDGSVLQSYQMIHPICKEREQLTTSEWKAHWSLFCCSLGRTVTARSGSRTPFPIHSALPGHCILTTTGASDQSASN